MSKKKKHEEIVDGNFSRTPVSPSEKKNQLNPQSTKNNNESKNSKKK